jgi:uncharacterized protein (TIGR02466 family)
MPTVITEEFILGFPTVIWHKVVKDAEAMNRALLAAVREKQAESPGTTHSNVGGWHSERDLFEWEEPAVALLLTAIHEAIKAVYAFQAQIKPSDFSMVVRSSGWANVNKPGDYNKLHIHANANWSGVYYVDAGDAEDPESGRLEFLDPRNRPNMFETAGTDRDDWFCISPKSGLLVLFPSWLYHTATPYHGTRDRVSLAFNLIVPKIMDPDGEPLPNPG